MQVAEVQDLIAKRDKKIKNLEEALDIKAKVEWEAPCYWLVDNNKKDGPFCQQCYDNDKKLIRLQGYGSEYLDCLTCKSCYAG